MGRIFWLQIVTVILVVSLSSNGLGQDSTASVERYASLASQSTDPGMSATVPDQTSLPRWLDRLLSRIPDRTDTRDIEKELDRKHTTEQSMNTEYSGPVIEGLVNIEPLYKSPPLEGEGVWTSRGMPLDREGNPLVCKTVYRPSVDFPNSIVYLAAFDLKRLKPRFFLGHMEPGIYEVTQPPVGDDLSKIVAITNAMWMQRHARGAGAIFRGQEIYPMVDGMATLVVYKDNSVDIVEWSRDIPRRLVKDARQLRYLIVKDGLVVEKVARNGHLHDAEIGLGGFLIDKKGRSTMGKKLWFLADRSAFGIRDDGNLVFAMGHHISTKDLAKALVLAGCKRAIHGDANIHNIVCNFYFRNDRDRIIKRGRLSPEQKQYTMRRYDQGYSKDFFAFYEKR